MKSNWMTIWQSIALALLAMGRAGADQSLTVSVNVPSIICPSASPSGPICRMEECERGTGRGQCNYPEVSTRKCTLGLDVNYVKNSEGRVEMSIARMSYNEVAPGRTLMNSIDMSKVRILVCDGFGNLGQQGSAAISDLRYEASALLFGVNGHQVELRPSGSGSNSSVFTAASFSLKVDNILFGEDIRGFVNYRDLNPTGAPSEPVSSSSSVASSASSQASSASPVAQCSGSCNMGKGVWVPSAFGCTCKSTRR